MGLVELPSWNVISISKVTLIPKCLPVSTESFFPEQPHKGPVPEMKRRGPSHSAFHNSFCDGGSAGSRWRATTARWDDVLMMSGADNQGQIIPLPQSISQSDLNTHSQGSFEPCGRSLIWSESCFVRFGRNLVLKELQLFVLSRWKSMISVVNILAL